MKRYMLIALFVSAIILLSSCTQQSGQVTFRTDYSFETEGSHGNLGWRSNDWVLFEYKDVVYGVVFGRQSGSTSIIGYQNHSSARYGLSREQFKDRYGDEITITGFYNATSGFGNFSFEGAMTRKEAGFSNPLRPIYVTNPERVVELCTNIKPFVYVDCVSRSVDEIAERDIYLGIEVCKEGGHPSHCIFNLARELAFTDTNTALDLCYGIVGWSVEYCSGEVVEEIVREEFIPPNLKDKEEKWEYNESMMISLIDTCNGLSSQRLTDACLTGLAHTAAKYNPAYMFYVCSMVEDEEMKVKCKDIAYTYSKIYFKVFSPHFNQTTTDILFDICSELVSGNHSDLCFSSIAGGVANFNATKAFYACEHVFERDNCFNSISLGLYYGFGAESFRNACEQINDKELKEKCLGRF